jgi:hypothetical protein
MFALHLFHVVHICSAAGGDISAAGLALPSLPSQALVRERSTELGLLLLFYCVLSWVSSFYMMGQSPQVEILYSYYTPTVLILYPNCTL